MKTAIVTGANGFVGEALIRLLIKKGVYVYAVTSSDITGLGREKGHRIIHCNMEEYRNLPNLIPKLEDAVFYHLAWKGTSGILRSDKELQLQNAESAVDALIVANSIGCEKFIFAASIGEYEIVHSVLEENGLTPDKMYSLGKLVADYMCRMESKKLGINYIAAVVSNIYGPGEKSERLINSMVRKLIKCEDIELTSGTQPYDFIYIDDAVEAFFQIGENGTCGRNYYIGNETTNSLRYYIQMIGRTMQAENHLKFGKKPFNGSGLNYGIFDRESLKKDFGFVPRISFEEGINRTIEWIKDNEQEEMNK